MMHEIWKHDLPTKAGDFTVVVPKGAEFLKLDVQNGHPVFWEVHEVDNGRSSETFDFKLVMTGQKTDFRIPVGRWGYLGTLNSQTFVLHVFIRHPEGV